MLKLFFQFPCPHHFIPLWLQTSVLPWKLFLVFMISLQLFWGGMRDASKKLGRTDGHICYCKLCLLLHGYCLVSLRLCIVYKNSKMGHAADIIKEKDCSLWYRYVTQPYLTECQTRHGIDIVCKIVIFQIVLNDMLTKLIPVRPCWLQEAN